MSEKLSLNPNAASTLGQLFTQMKETAERSKDKSAYVETPDFKFILSVQADGSFRFFGGSNR